MFIGIFIAVVNYFFRTLMIYFAYLLKPATVTQEMNWVKDAIFCVSFINGGILLILMSAKSHHRFIGYFLNGVYADFTPMWFNDIGQIVVSNLMTNAFYPFIELLL